MQMCILRACTNADTQRLCQRGLSRGSQVLSLASPRLHVLSLKLTKPRTKQKNLRRGESFERDCARPEARKDKAMLRLPTLQRTLVLPLRAYSRPQQNLAASSRQC